MNSTPLFLYRFACRLLAGVCMAYMTITLVNYLQVDVIGYFPSIAQWLVGFFLTVMIFITGKTQSQFLNPLFLIGLAGLVAIY